MAAMVAKSMAAWDQPGTDLIKYGTSRFDDTLVRDHLIDEFRFWIMPVVAGAGHGCSRTWTPAARPQAHRREEAGVSQREHHGPAAAPGRPTSALRTRGRAACRQRHLVGFATIRAY
jgi:hypothetical protein